MQPTLDSLESRHKALYRKLEAVGDFRRGTELARPVNGMGVDSIGRLIHNLVVEGD